MSPSSSKAVTDLAKKPIRSFIHHERPFSEAAEIRFQELYQENLKQEKLLRTKNIYLDIGCGNGESVLNFLERTTAADLIVAIDVYKAGISHLLENLQGISDQLRQRVLALNEDFETFFKEHIAAGDLHIQGVHIFYPDPWPKRKHIKRRLFRLSFFEKISEFLHSGSYIYFLTDKEDYYQFSVEEVSMFLIKNDKISYFSPLVDRFFNPNTKYMKKFLKMYGIVIIFH